MPQQLVIKKILLGFTALLVAYNFFLASFFARIGEVNLTNDIARDFLILREITEKKVVLIGPRSNVNGLFHGPLWAYLNYPVFLLGHGNPAVQAWFWLLLCIGTVALGAYLTKRLFGLVPACVVAILLSAQMIFRANDGYFHGYATIFVVIPYFYTIARYSETGKWRFLIINLLCCAIMSQFMISALPIFGITFLISAVTIFRKKLYLHFLTFFTIPLFFLNYIIFDWRHDFFIIKSALAYSQSQQHALQSQGYFFDRLWRTVDLQLGSWIPMELIIFLFVAVMVATLYKIITDRKNRTLFILFPTIYFGFMISTLFNKGLLLSPYYYPMMPLAIVWFAALVSGKTKIIFAVLTGIIIFFNIRGGNAFVTNLRDNLVRKDMNSWLGMSDVAKDVISHQGTMKDFGYFVFAPDAFAYQPRYAMIYNFEAAGMKAHEYAKYNSTYVIAQPPPSNDPYMTHVWWRKNPVGIKSEPLRVAKFPNGFVVEEFVLSDEETKVPHDKTMELGLHFR